MYQGKTGRGGYITVIFHQANNCVAKDITNTSDVYAIVGLVDKETGSIDGSKPTARTPIIFSTLNPVWHSYQECGPFPHLDANTEIMVELYDVDTYGPDELMGSTTVLLKDIPESFSPAMLPLTIDGESGGQVFVEWCYRPIGAGDGDIPDEWFIPRHDRLRWKYILGRADDSFASSQASALALLPPSLTQSALSGDEGVLRDLPVKKTIVRIFTSSTFTDTKLERNMLMRDVYPFLSRLCRKLGLTFEVVDMRWGVREATNDSHNTSSLCMKELQKCLKNSLGPAFVCFLGEKYGYRPFPAKIPANFMSKMWPFIRQAELEYAEEVMKSQKIKWNLLKIATKDSVSPAELWDNLGANQAYVQSNDIFLVPTWFRLDMNASGGGEYVLMNITDLIPEFRSNDQTVARAASSRWWKIFERMQKTLRDASKVAFKETNPFGITYSPSLQRDVHFSDRFNISVTHEEVVNGILHNNNRNTQSYCFRSSIADIESPLWNANKPKFIDGGNKDGKMSIDTDARELLQTLKTKNVPSVLASPRIFDRSISPDELYMDFSGEELDRLEKSDSHHTRREFCDHFCELISEDILEAFSNTSNQVAMDPVVSEIRPHLFFQCSKRDSFVPRPELEKQIMKFIEEESSVEGIKNHQFPLVVLAPSGAGKSTLMAQCASAAKKAIEKAVVVSRYIGTTPGSTHAASLLRSICLQIFLIYGTESAGNAKPPRLKGVNQETIEKEEDPTKLGSMLLQELNSFPTAARPLYLFIDALDQLFDPFKLAWIPVRVENANCRVVISLLDSSSDQDGISNLESLKLIHPCVDKASKDWIINVPGFTLAEAKQLLEKELKGRTLTTSQTKAVLDCIEKAVSPTPLFVKMLIDFAGTWRSFTAPALSTEKLQNIREPKDLVVLLFQQLETVHGIILVSRAMGYLMASKCGLSSIEMEDMLSCDEDVLSDVYQWWTPPIRRIPPLLWKRIVEDLGSNLVEYAADEGAHSTTVYKWYHRQFSEVCEQRYLPDVQTRMKFHDALANYFEGLYSSPTEIPYMSKPENKKVSADRMIPPQPLSFNASTYNSRKLSELPYHHLFCSGPRRLLNSLLSFEFIEAKCGAGMIQELKIDFKRAAEVLERLKDPLASTLKQFYEFILRNSHILGAINRESHVSVQFHLQALQLALNMPDTSAVYILAKKQWDENYCHSWKRPLLRTEKATTSDPCLFTFTSHTKAISALAVAPNESRVISSDKLRASSIWDPKKGAETFSFHTTYAPYAICVSSDSTKCVLGYRYEDPITIINIHNGQELKKMKGSHSSTVHCCWISNDEQRIVTGGKDKKVIIWDTETGDRVATLEGHEGPVNKVSVNESETMIVSASSDHTLRVWNFSGELIKVIKEHSGAVYSCKFRADGHFMSSSADRTVRVWSSSDYQEITRFEYSGEVYDFCISSDGKKLITVGADKLVNVKDLQTGQKIAAFAGHMMKICACLPMQNNRVITSSEDRTIKIWDLDAEANTQTSSRENVFKLAHSRSVYFRMPDPQTIETVHFEQNSKLSEIKLAGPNAEGKKELIMDLSKDGKVLVTIIKPVIVRLWDTETGSIIKEIPIKEEFSQMKISSNKKQLIALVKKSLFFLDVETANVYREIEGPNNCVAFNYSTNEEYIAVVYFGDYCIKLFNSETGALISTMVGPHTHPPRSIVISETGKVVSGGPDKKLVIWDGLTGREIKCIPQVDWVWDLAVSGDFLVVNNRVAVGLWHLESLQLLGLIPASQSPFSELHIYSETKEVIGIANKELHYFTF